MSVLWSGKPFLKKTVAKFFCIFVVITILLSFIFVLFPLLIPLWLAFSFIFFLFYYFNKRAFTYFITDKSVRVEKSWVFGNYVREITFDQIRDAHVMQGIPAEFSIAACLFLSLLLGLRLGMLEEGQLLAEAWS